MPREKPSRFNNVNSKQIVKVVEKPGFRFVRQSGTSHAINIREADRKRTTVPIHGKVSLKRKTIKAICRDIKITIDELRYLL